MDFSRIASIIDIPRMQRSTVTVVGNGGGANLCRNLVRCGTRRTKTTPVKNAIRRTDTNVLKRYREQWNPQELPELARHLREFLQELEKTHRSSRKARD